MNEFTFVSWRELTVFARCQNVVAGGNIARSHSEKRPGDLKAAIEMNNAQ